MALIPTNVGALRLTRDELRPLHNRGAVLETDSWCLTSRQSAIEVLDEAVNALKLTAPLDEKSHRIDRHLEQWARRISHRVDDTERRLRQAPLPSKREKHVKQIDAQGAGGPVQQQHVL